MHSKQTKFTREDLLHFFLLYQAKSVESFHSGMGPEDCLVRLVRPDSRGWNTDHISALILDGKGSRNKKFLF